MTDDEHEANLERNRDALIASIRRMHADDDSDAFEEHATALSILAGTLIVNLNALVGDRAGITVMAQEVDDRHVEAAADALGAILLHAFQLMKHGLDD